MQTDLRAVKTGLRRKIRAALADIPPEKHAADSVKICARLRELAVWQNARTVLLFAPMQAEPDVWPLLAEALAARKIAALPRFNPAGKNYVAGRVQNLESEIVSGKFGIREPTDQCPEISPGRFDLILAPGVAFDRYGHRLGRGRGYYDRLLADVKGVKCGIAFDEQWVSNVPAGAADVRVDFIVTPTRGVEIAV
jgi:5-formyltetrahydrofolate cyclo-ligase